jgi:integrase
VYESPDLDPPRPCQQTKGTDPSHNLKLYAAEADIKKIHIHQLRHTFGQMVADETGSLDEVQEALGHRNRSTTRVYVQRITRKRDKHSRRISERLRKPT